MLNVSWVMLLFLMLFVFFRQKNFLSPTGIFIGYSALIFPISFLVSGFFGIGSVFFGAPSEIPIAMQWSAFFAVVLGICSFWFGRHCVGIGSLRWPDFEIKLGNLKLLIFLSTVMAGVSAAYLFNVLGGVSRVFSELGAIRSGELSGLGVYTYAITMLLPTSMQFVMIYLIRINHPRKNISVIFCVLSSLLGGVFGFRGPVMALLLQVFSIYFLMTGRPSRKTMLIILMVLVPAATISGFLRVFLNEAFWDLAGKMSSSDMAAYASDLLLTRVRGVETFVVMKGYVDFHGFGYFIDNFRESIFSVFPAIFFEKGNSLSEIIATNVYGKYLFDAGVLKDVYGGVSYTYIAEAYWGFGFAGVSFFCLLFGVLFRVVECGRSISLVRIILYKSLAGFCLLLVETPQLGLNAIVVNVAFNFALMFFLAISFLGIRRNSLVAR